MDRHRAAAGRRTGDRQNPFYEAGGDVLYEASLLDPAAGSGEPLLLVSILTGEVKIDRLRELWPTWAEPFKTGNGGRRLGIRGLERNEPVVTVGAAHH